MNLLSPAIGQSPNFHTYQRLLRGLSIARWSATLKNWSCCHIFNQPIVVATQLRRLSSRSTQIFSTPSQMENSFAVSIRANRDIRHSQPQHPAVPSRGNIWLPWHATPVDAFIPRWPNPVYSSWRQIDCPTAIGIWHTSRLCLAATAIYALHGRYWQGHPSIWSESSQLCR